MHETFRADNNRNHSGFGICRWDRRRLRVSEINSLDENFQCHKAGGVWSDPAEFVLESMGRQARAIPQNWEARCPGSLRTNWENPHLRAGVTQPTSATSFKRGSWLDHPRSSYMESIREPPERTGPGARCNLEAARGTQKFLRVNSRVTAGSILAQENIHRDS